MNQGTMAVIAVSALLAAWYAAGHVYNRGRGLRFRRWLEAGLSALEGEREAGWIGSPASGARINVRRAKRPFRRLQVTLLLENREIPLLWLLDRLRGRRDRIILRGTLRSPRRGEVRVTSDGSAGAEAGLADGLTTWQGGRHGLSVTYRGPKGQPMADALEPWLDTYGPYVRRLHWRQEDPHINLQLKTTGLLETKAETLFTDLSSALRAR
jgi:hypothetical protein